MSTSIGVASGDGWGCAACGEVFPPGERVVYNDIVQPGGYRDTWHLACTPPERRAPRRVVIAGSRGYDYPEAARLVDEAVTEWERSHPGERIAEVVCGCAGGIDAAGGHCVYITDRGREFRINAELCKRRYPNAWHAWACRNRVPVSHYPYIVELGRRGGKVRNSRMARYCHELIAVWDGRSPGTADIIARVARLHKPSLVMDGGRLDAPRPGRQSGGRDGDAVRDHQGAGQGAGPQP